MLGQQMAAAWTAGLQRASTAIRVHFRSASQSRRGAARKSQQTARGKTPYNYLPMFVRCRHRLITVLFALFSLLSMQLAVAGYACPVDSKVSQIAAMAEAGMPCAGDMSSVDAEQPGLCHAHCQSAQQSVEKVQAPTPMAAISTGFAYTVEPSHVSAPRSPAQPPTLLRSSAPPITVRNCCFRI
ncbi:MAG: hypothetical protein Q8Q73_08210 [Stagnimonas sp.]|nr:hypothetical protein [Stagnimonas sp.]